MNTLKSLFVIDDRVLEEDLPISTRAFVVQSIMLVAAMATFILVLHL
jgi:hypothetical protein